MKFRHNTNNLAKLTINLDPTGGNKSDTIKLYVCEFILCCCHVWNEDSVSCKEGVCSAADWLKLRSHHVRRSAETSMFRTKDHQSQDSCTVTQLTVCLLEILCMV